jgi:hypothetical protein
MDKEQRTIILQADKISSQADQILALQMEKAALLTSKHKVEIENIDLTYKVKRLESMIELLNRKDGEDESI